MAAKPQAEIIVSSNEKAIRNHRIDHPGEFLVSRDPSCFISLTDDGVSHKHVNLTLLLDQWFVEDRKQKSGASRQGNEDEGFSMKDGPNSRFRTVTFRRERSES